MAEVIIPRRRFATKRNNLVEMVAWRVPESNHYPEGIKYSFVFIQNNKRLIAFDNYAKEGHHMRIISAEKSLTPIKA